MELKDLFFLNVAGMTSVVEYEKSMWPAELLDKFSHSRVELQLGFLFVMKVHHSCFVSKFILEHFPELIHL